LKTIFPSSNISHEHPSPSPPLPGDFFGEIDDEDEDASVIGVARMRRFLSWIGVSRILSLWFSNPTSELSSPNAKLANPFFI
jgi:hypothetical protein